MTELLKKEFKSQKMNQNLGQVSVCTKSFGNFPRHFSRSSMASLFPSSEDEKESSIILPPLVFTKPVPPNRDAVFATSPDIQLDLSSLVPLPSPLVHWGHSSNDIQQLRLQILLPLKKSWKSYPHQSHDSKRLKGVYSRSLV